eukprot:454588-Rhodomonas_salina.3
MPTENTLSKKDDPPPPDRTRTTTTAINRPFAVPFLQERLHVRVRRHGSVQDGVPPATQSTSRPARNRRRRAVAGNEARGADGLAPAARPALEAGRERAVRRA